MVFPWISCYRPGAPLCRFLGLHLGGPHTAPGALHPQRLRHAADAGGAASRAAGAGAQRAVDGDAAAPGMKRDMDSDEIPKKTEVSVGKSLDHQKVMGKFFINEGFIGKIMRKS